MRGCALSLLRGFGDEAGTGGGGLEGGREDGVEGLGTGGGGKEGGRVVRVRGGVSIEGSTIVGVLLSSLASY